MTSSSMDQGDDANANQLVLPSLIRCIHPAVHGHVHHGALTRGMQMGSSHQSALHGPYELDQRIWA